MERTLVLLKPDAVQRGLVGELVSRLEARGLKLVAMKLMVADEALARRHYAEHTDKPFFHGLVEFITSGPSQSHLHVVAHELKDVPGRKAAPIWLIKVPHHRNKPI